MLLLCVLINLVSQIFVLILVSLSSWPSILCFNVRRAEVLSDWACRREKHNSLEQMGRKKFVQIWQYCYIWKNCLYIEFFSANIVCYVFHDIYSGHLISIVSEMKCTKDLQPPILWQLWDDYFTSFHNFSFVFCFCFF